MIAIQLGNISLKFDINLLKEFVSYKQDNLSKSESGGILIGYFIDNYSCILTDISHPTKFDKASRYNFTRSKQSAQQFIFENFKKSRGKKIYLGEWHTHPESNPNPSILDLESFKNQLELNTLNSSLFFMFIIGLKSVYIAGYKGKDFYAEQLLEFEKLNNQFVN